jgi:hypothetical protein
MVIRYIISSPCRKIQTQDTKPMYIVNRVLNFTKKSCFRVNDDMDWEYVSRDWSGVWAKRPEMIVLEEGNKLDNGFEFDVVRNISR